MEGILKSDIFFFVTTIAVILIAAGLIVVIVYAVKILKDVRYISGKVKEESDEIIKDIKSLRGEVKKEGTKIRNIFDFFIGFLKPGKKNKRGKK